LLQLKETYAMFQRSVRIVLATCAVAAVPLAAGAQGTRGPIISGSASVMVPLKPTAVRMTLRLQAQDKELKQAMAKLRQQRDSVLKKLETLRPLKDTIKYVGPSPVTAGSVMPTIGTATIAYKAPVATPSWGPPTLGPPVGPATGVPAPVPGPSGPPPIVVVGAVTAEWPLQGDNIEKLLIEASELQKKIEAADLTGGKKPKKSDSDDESSEEDKAVPSTYAPSTAPYTPAPAIYGSPFATYAPGVPAWDYVARISAQQRKAAMAQAVVKAKARAAELAEAAGTGLGALESVRLAQVTGGTSWSDDAISTVNMYEDETVGTDPNKLRIAVTVDVCFRIKP
jgi:uncharacterized protein YggE